MLNISIEIENQVVFDRTLSRFSENLKDFRQVWPAVTVELRQILKEQFAGQGVGPSGQWAALSPAYKEWKEKKYPGQPILVRTGATRAALTTSTQHSINVPTATTLTFGVALPYPAFHQRGGKKLPRRKIFDFTEAQKVRIVKVIQRRLLNAGGNNGVTLS